MKPTILIVDDEPGVRTALSPYVLRTDGPNGYGQRLVIRETAAPRGLPVQLPPSEQESAAVTVDDIEAGDLAKLWHRSEGAGALLSGVLSITADGYWDISWRLAWHDRARAWASFASFRPIHKVRSTGTRVSP